MFQLKGFTDNLLKANTEKHHFHIDANEERYLNLYRIEKSNSKYEKLLEIKIFKLNALSRVLYQSDFNQRKI